MKLLSRIFQHQGHSAPSLRIWRSPAERADHADWPAADAFRAITDEQQLTDGRAVCTRLSVGDSSGDSCQTFHVGDKVRMRLVVTEYPKSGGSWVTSLLGDALALPKRDIYIRDGHTAFDVSHHPWYKGASSLNLTEACVIKSHERPGSPLFDFPARYLHVLRDGRDVVVSRYFFEKDFCVKNGIYQRFDTHFDEYVARQAADWRDYVTAWLGQDVPTCRYEDFLESPATALRRVLDDLGLAVPEDQVCRAVEMNTKAKFKKALDETFQHNTFVRKGVAGDWRDHFREEHVAAFNEAAGGLLARLGYATDCGCGGGNLAVKAPYQPQPLTLPGKTH